MTSSILKSVTGAAREVLPVVSTSKAQSRSNVLALYKKVQRVAPDIYKTFLLHDIPLPVFRSALKKQFSDNSHLTDIRVIDRKIAECREVILGCQKTWYNPVHLRNMLFRENVETKPKDFLSTFLRSKN